MGGSAQSNCRGASPPLLNHGLHAIDATLCLATHCSKPIAKVRTGIMASTPSPRRQHVTDLFARRSADDVAKAFIPHYYNLFDTNREGLASLFRNESQFTFEGDGPKAGAPAIMEKLRTLPPVQHQPQTIETQPLREPKCDPRLLHGQHPRRTGQAPQILRGVPARRVGAGPVLPAQRHLPIQLRVVELGLF